MIVSNYVYSNIEEAVVADAITKIEALIYKHQANRLMKGQRLKKEFITDIQFKLDRFFKRDELDFEDFKKLCVELSGDRFVTTCCFDLFKRKGLRCYYTDKGETINVEFESRFDKKSELL